MDTTYPDMRILGWYHTHPGHGIFLSDMDLFIHKHFFNLPWHVAFVFDPQNQEEGLFAWRSANMAIESFVVQKDMPPIGQKVARRVPEPYVPSVQYATPGSDPGQTPPATAAASAVAVPAPGLLAASAPAMNVPPGARPAAAAEVNEFSARIQTLEKRQRWVTAALALAVLVAVGWPIVLSALAILRSTEDPASTSPNPILPTTPIHPSPPGASPTSVSAGKLTEPTTRVASDADVQQH
jgi:hypothetical protein